MNKKFRPARLAAIITAFVCILTVYCITLYKYQIYDPARAVAEEALVPGVTTRHNETISAARGEILDRNGEKLVSSVPSYNISLSRTALNATGAPNDIIWELIELVSKAGKTHNDTFPITQGAPYEYAYNITKEQRSRLDKYFEYFKLDPEMTASDFIVWLKKHYGIPYTTGVAEARMIIGVRYELEIRVLVYVSPYVFAEDLPLELVSAISERAFPGVFVQTATKRVYHTAAAAHLLGYIGKMDSKDIDYYTELGYPMDAMVGRSGVESAFEEYLHGTDGTRTVVTDLNGAIVSEEITEPVPGMNVYLTIDRGLQEASEKALADVIASINLTRGEDEQKAQGGALVAIDVKTGETLSLASYPTFDLATIITNYTALSNDELTPLFNRATQGTYNPGSTFKPITALAALRAGTITRNTLIEDKGIYTKYETTQPRCWLYTSGFGATHGWLDVVGALAHSCNYFFYEAGGNTGPSRIAQAARDFGFGEKTGIEIGDKEGVVASVESKKEIQNLNWYDADTLFTAIGQGISGFTPVQIANYAATIANGGTLRELTLLHAVKTSDYSGTVFKNAPVIRSEIEDKEFVSILKEGMRGVVTYGTAHNDFRSFPVEVAAKTGTVQTGGTVNNGVFICYAPASDPEIAIAVVVEKGGSGAAIIEAAKEVLSEYFKSPSSTTAAVEGMLIP